MTLTTLVYKNLTRKWTRFVLTGLSIAVAFLLFGFLQSFREAWNSGVENASDTRLVTVNKINFTQPLPYSYFTRIQTMEGVQAVTHASWFGGFYQEPQNFVQAFAVDPTLWLGMYPEMKAPPEQIARFIENRAGVMVGNSVAKRFGWQVGDRIPLSSNIFSQQGGGSVWDVEIEAIYTPEANFDGSIVLLHYEYFNESKSFGKDTIGWLVVQTTSPQVNDAVIAAIDNQFANSSAETDTVTEKAFSEQFQNQFGNISLILTLVIAGAFVTILMIVGFNMVLAQRERIGELAVMKTLGFRSHTLFGLMMGEALALSLIGGLVGLALGALVTFLFTILSAGFLPPMAVSAETSLQALALMVGLGLITGTIPAYQAYRTRIITAFARN